MYPLGRKIGVDILQCVNEVILICLICHLFGIQITVPKGVITESDDIKIDTVITQFGVVIDIVSGIGGPIGMNDDLRLGAHFTHGVATGFEQTYIACPIIA